MIMAWLDYWTKNTTTGLGKIIFWISATQNCCDILLQTSGFWLLTHQEKIKTSHTDKSDLIQFGFQMLKQLWSLS